MVVVAFGFDMQGGEHGESDGLEEMFRQFGAEIADFIAFKFRFEFDKWSAG